MFQPVHVRRADVGVRLQPLGNSVFRLPAFDNSGYQYLKDPPLIRKLSSLQSHRSRVFARREQQQPNLASPQQQNRAGRHSEPLRNTQNVTGPRSFRQSKLYSAPQPAGKPTVNHLPNLHEHGRGDKLSPKQPPRNASKGQSYERSEGSPSRLLSMGSHIAGMSSKEQEIQILRNDKMASGWAEARAGHTIPNLREPHEDEKFLRGSEKDQSPAGRNTVEQESTDNRLNLLNVKKDELKADVKSPKEKMARKQSEDCESIGSGSKPARKMPYIRKTVQVNIKSKISSGYGSMSSGSQQGDEAGNKYSVFKQSTNNDSTIGSAKTKEMASVYKSKVRVEDTRTTTMGNNTPAQEHILTENEAYMYTHIKSAYKQTAELERERRKQKFFRKLQDVQIEAALQHNKELRVKAAKKEQAGKRQLEQLEHIRNKFEEDRHKRYKSQYVTKNFLNYERMDRKEYGLPEHFMNKTEYEAKLKRTGGVKVTALDFIKREVKLKKNYVKMFKEPTSVQSISTKDPKREGKEQITLDIVDGEGNPKKGKKVDVKSELKEATEMIKDIDMEDDLLDTDVPPPVMPVEPKVTPPKAISSGSSQRGRNTSSKTQQRGTTTASKNVAEKPKTTQSSAHLSSRHSNTSVKSAISSENSTRPRTNSLAKNPVIKVDHPPEKLSSPITSQPAQLVYGSTGIVAGRKPLDTLSINSRISVITEESETGVDFYEQLMAKYGIELSDDDDDE